MTRAGNGNGNGNAGSRGNAPAPLVPAEVDLRGFSYMGLEVERLMTSDLFALATGDEFKAAVALWCRSWHQIPAGSLPADDRILAFLTHTGPAWPALRDMALHGWVLCSDGRYYHPMVAAKALEAWDSKQGGQKARSKGAEKMRRWRERRAQLAAAARQGGEGPPEPPAGAPPEGPAEVMDVTVTVTGTEVTEAGNVTSLRERGIPEQTQGESGPASHAREREREAEPTVAHLNPRLSDGSHLWAGVCKGRFGRDEQGASVPMAGARGDVEWELIPACRRIAGAALMAANWRGDWGTVVEWLERGWDLNDHIVPAIERIAERKGYRQPAKLRYFTEIIEEFIALRQRAG